MNDADILTIVREAQVFVDRQKPRSQREQCARATMLVRLNLVIDLLLERGAEEVISEEEMADIQNAEY